MLFPTIDFAIFFGIVFILNWLLAPFPRRWKVFILIASYVFYGWWDWRFVFLLMASTITTIIGGALIHRAMAMAEPERRVLLGRVRWPTLSGHAGATFYLVATVALELGLLGWFKYYGFVAVSVDNAFHRLGMSPPVPLLNITLPVGISFFTFVGLSYVIDIYRKKIEPSPALDVAVFVSFFPHLVAGPIVRGADLLPQIRQAHRRSPRRIDLPQAAYLIFGGLFKKVVLSSYVSSAIVDPVFANPKLHSAPEIIFAVWGYAVQIYCDFSGYTDIAIGCALLLGFKFPQNFNSPYAARSLQDFWRRWHMTLSFWLRDYLYIPLGGSKGSNRELYKNLIITEVLGGLWHGAAWTFVVWGALHGTAQCVGHYRRRRRVARGLPPQDERKLAVAWQRFATFQIVCVGWIFFRATSFGDAWTMIERLFTAWGQSSPLVRWPVVLAIAFGIFTQYVPHGFVRRIQEAFGQMRPVVQGSALAAVLLITTTMGPPGVAPFIYFRF